LDGYNAAKLQVYVHLELGVDPLTTLS